MFRTKHLLIVVVTVAVLLIISIAVLTRRHTAVLPIASDDAAQFVEGNTTLNADVRTDTTKEDARETLIKELKANVDNIPSIQQNNNKEEVIPLENTVETEQEAPIVDTSISTTSPSTSTEEVI